MDRLQKCVREQGFLKQRITGVVPKMRNSNTIMYLKNNDLHPTEIVKSGKTCEDHKIFISGDASFAQMTCI